MLCAAVGATTQLCTKPGNVTYQHVEAVLSFAGGAASGTFTATSDGGGKLTADIGGTAAPAKCGGNCL